jgi:hypothetical protein
MTLHDLTEQLSPYFTPSVQKDLKTAVRVLAQALGHPEPKSCPVEACLQPLPQLYRMVETHLISHGKSPHTIRNTKNNLSRLFRLAELHGLFALLPVQPQRRFAFNEAIHVRSGGRGRWEMSRYALPHRDWPLELQQAFAAFTKWATDPMVVGRDAKWKKRPSTITVYRKCFEMYFGYLYHHLQINPVTFDHLFQADLIKRFVDWHINERSKRTTMLVHQVVKFIQAIARQYHPNPQLVESLNALKKHLPTPRPYYNKNDAWVSLHQLKEVGLALWPSKSPTAIRGYGKHPGAGLKFAGRAAISLMLRLWVHIPYRQRNMREMKLGQNLYQTPTGQWRIRFANEELKIATKRGQPNVFDLPFPPTLLETLQVYLTVWRPLLVRSEETQEVFLNRYGQPFNRDPLANTVKGHVYSFTGRRWHPHLIRTTWATEWIQSSGDFMTAAIMLNDRLETVIQNYSHLRDENVAENAYEWVQGRVNGH